MRFVKPFVLSVLWSQVLMINLEKKKNWNFSELLLISLTPTYSDFVPAYKKTESWGIQAVRGLPCARGRRVGGTAEGTRRGRGQRS